MNAGGVGGVVSHRSRPGWVALLSCVALLSGCAATGGPIELPPPAPSIAQLQILAINDFHGNLDPADGANGRWLDTPVGGIEFLATHINSLRRAAPNTLVLSGGDNIGGSPMLSALFHDEPTIEALSTLGLDFSTVGNHEFDEGWAELERLQRGGCRTTTGCQVTEFRGARFTYLAANVQVDERRDTLFPGTAMRTIDGIRVGVIGLALQTTPELVSPASVRGLTFLPAGPVASAAARQLRAQGADVVVAMIHEGGFLAPDDTNAACPSMSGGLVQVLADMNRDIDVVVSGHTNRSYTCRIDGRIVTSTASYGRQITDIDLTIDRMTRRVVHAEARNVPVTRDVARDPEMTAIVERYRPKALEIGSRPVGALAATLRRAATPTGESEMGNLVADALLEASSAPGAGGAQLAFINWGGVRSDLVHLGDSPTSSVTYEDAFETLPFGNVLVVKTMSGALLAAMLEQQFQAALPTDWKILQPSHNVRYRWNGSLPAGSRVDRASIAIDSEPLRLDASYRVAMTDFVWDGGDGFTAATAATDAFVVAPALDVLIDYLGRHSPLTPAPLGRITRDR
jgi:5'-nucleotidase